MSNHTISAQATEQFVTTMTERMAQLARTLSTWVQAESLPIQALEAQVVRVLHDLGTDLLTGLCQLVASQRPAPDVACPCGQMAHYQRMRPVQITTLVGAVTFTRAYYTCSACGHGHAPLDTVFQCAAGSLSMGLMEVLALLGATQDSFAQATEVLERLCLVQVCPNSARAATEDRGAVLRAHDQAVVAALETTPALPTAATAAPPRLYLRMDGVVTHIHKAGWKELKTGCVYTTRTRIPRQRPDQVVIFCHFLAATPPKSDKKTLRGRRAAPVPPPLATLQQP